MPKQEHDDTHDDQDDPLTLQDVLDAFDEMHASLEQRINDQTELLQEVDSKLDELQDLMESVSGLGDGYSSED